VGASILQSIYAGTRSSHSSYVIFINGYGGYPTVGDPDLMRVHHRTYGRGFEMPDYEQLDWDLVSRVKASERRTQVLKILCEKPRMNSELADELDVSTKWARRQVKWLEERRLVQDLTEEKRNYKLYRATEKGKQILEVL
jgi:DNA-binding MarR family transcriptional regulator